ncbi:hypothetical protein EUGRSUZ_H00048 [Eucalyptus grandis]|uniref:Uncharacterized protein n=2 Tax=Eucalyptus grandis TaxID=71139 RepID=A0ACC3JKY0_EUCGR|nr:hypothetical protein EUGRSUZ_H00048 [Eucalyptus grandis]
MGSHLSHPVLLHRYKLAPPQYDHPAKEVLLHRYKLAPPQYDHPAKDESFSQIEVVLYLSTAVCDVRSVMWADRRLL